MPEPLLRKNRAIGGSFDCNLRYKFLKIKGKAMELGHMDPWHA